MTSRPLQVNEEDFLDDTLPDECERCHGDGWIYECDGDASDWQEDTYCGSDDAVIPCRACNGTGVIK